MAESSLTATYLDLQQIASLEMGWGRGTSSAIASTLGDPINPDSQWSNANKVDFQIACKEGYRRFLYPDPLPGENKSHNWSFLYPIGKLQLTSGYSTGTIDDITGSTVGASGTSWLTLSDWVPGAVLEVTGDNGVPVSIPIDTINSNTSITLESTSSLWEDPTAASSLSSYLIRRDSYALPDDFGGMHGDGFTFRRDEQWHLPNIQIIGESEVRKMDRAYNGEIYPRFATLTPIAPTAATASVGGNSTRWLVKFYPMAEQTYYLDYRYHAIPPALNSQTNVYHYGGAEHSQTIVCAVIDALYRRLHASTEKSEEFHNRLRQSVLHDRRNYTPGYLGKSNPGPGSLSGRETLRQFRQNTAVSNITTTFT